MNSIWSDNRSRMWKHLWPVNTVVPAYSPWSIWLAHPKIVWSGITPSVPVLKETAQKPKTLLNNLNFLMHLLKIEWMLNPHFLVLLSMVSHFTLLIYCSSNSTVSSQIVYLCRNRYVRQLWYVEFIFKMAKRRADLAFPKKLESAKTILQ